MCFLWNFHTATFLLVGTLDRTLVLFSGPFETGQSPKQVQSMALNLLGGDPGLQSEQEGWNKKAKLRLVLVTPKRVFCAPTPTLTCLIMTAKAHVDFGGLQINSI